MCLAVPAQIISIEGESFFRTGKVSFAGAVKEVSLAYVPEAKIEDYVLVHAGVALNTIDEEEAKKVFEYLEGLEPLGMYEE